MMGYGNESCEIGPLADLGFLNSHSNAKKQLSHHSHQGIREACRFRGNRETIADVRRQAGNNNHLMARSYLRGEGVVAYGSKMHKSLPDSEVITGQIKRYNQQPAAAHRLCTKLGVIGCTRYPRRAQRA